MSTVAIVLALVLMGAGLVGIVLPVLPGLLLVWAGVLVWAVLEQSVAAWTVLAVGTVLVLLGVALEYLVPGRRMRRAGVRTSSLVLGVLVAVVAAFVLPIAGALVGFPAGIYLAERVRRGSHREGWAATVHALRAVGLNILIELMTALVVIGLWVGALLWWV
ncbi:DUF456 domain-containing protein [Ornithinicoccus halotolerans]|uniref:DUF456 domain-containing protein n=1 Tax=Ornithinicoccus halotolerans TaxID=1748220 RepID=UPI001E3490A6|nr:DUF456 domain-containing protein [Ornithinicoccus halotolerans]